MKVHYCDEIGCHKIIPFDQRYCDQHAKLHQWQHVDHKQAYKHYNRDHRDHQADSFYHSKQWQAVRNAVVNRDYYCDAVDGMVIKDQDLIVDHIVRRDLCDDPLDPSNLWCLSRHHHWIKTKLEQAMLSKPNGKGIVRHCSKQNWIKYIKEYETRTKTKKS